MYSTYLPAIISPTSAVRKFQRRQDVPMIENLLWHIDSGVVRTITVHRDGVVSTLGFWGEGDIVGHPLAGINTYQIECLSKVSLHRVAKDERILSEALHSHLHQSQALLMIRHGLMEDRFKQFLGLLARKFSKGTEEGCCIPNFLTHQDVAEAIDATRVTVSRLIGQFESQGLIQWSRTECLISPDAKNQFLSTLI